MLHQHAMLRQEHANSVDFDKSFLVDESIENASAAAIIANRLSLAEAKKEEAILLYFSTRFTLLHDMALSQVNTFYKNLTTHKVEVAAFMKKACDFTETKSKVIVPVFLVANPDNGNGGGEANGGRLVIELQDSSYVMPSLIHESLHFLLNPHIEQIKTASDSAQADWQVISEGIAYAMEGLVEDADRLPNALIWNLTHGGLLSDRYTQFYMAGITFRPILRTALEEGETITTFLPKIIKVWKQINQN